MYKLEKSITNIIKYIYGGKNKTVNIGYGIDDNYARCTGTSIASICLNNKNMNFSFHIIAANFSVSTKEKFKILAEQYRININIYEIDINCLKDLPTKRNLPISMYFRLILPILLYDIKQIIYLDADVICLNSIDKLININMEEYIIGAVPDLKKINEERIKSLKLNNHIYFNSGVLLINNDKWNTFNTVEKVLMILNKDELKETLLFPDQDALNIVLTQNIKYLSSKYNCIDIDSIDKYSKVFVHFTASPKPWHLAWFVNRQCNKFNANLYQEYEKKTPWANIPLVLPRDYKEMEYFSKDLRKAGKYIMSLKWYIKYLIKKIIR